MSEDTVITDQTIDLNKVTLLGVDPAKEGEDKTVVTTVNVLPKATKKEKVVEPEVKERKLADHVVRMGTELDELIDRATKLSTFIDGSKFSTLSPLKQTLMRQQLAGMTLYGKSLQKRYQLEL